MVSLRLTAVALITIIVVSHQAEAKRGCSAFGHSCYGGHGKRSGDTPPNDGNEPGLMNSLLNTRRQTGQEEVPSHTVYPPGSSLNGILSADDIIPVRDGGAYDHEENDVMKELMKFRLRNIVKHWVDNYRRRNDLNSEEAFLLDPAL